MLFRTAFISLFFFLVFAQAIVAKLHVSLAEDFERHRDITNEHLDYLNKNTVCEGTVLAISCGDGICDFDESALTCEPDCTDALVKSYNRLISCEDVKQVYKPKTIEEVQAIVATANVNNQHVRVVGSLHSVNDQYCTDGVVISTENLNHVIGIEGEPDGTESVIVEAGVTLGELATFLHKQSRSLGYAVLGFRKASVGGAIANGAHGSSYKHDAVISNAVRAITIVTANGDVLEISENDGDLLRAVRAHLGLLGVVVKIKLLIIPQFRLHVTVTTRDETDLLKNGPIETVKDCDYAFINWFPTSEKYILACGVETSKDPNRGAENTLLKPSVPPGLLLPYRVALHYGMCDDQLNAGLERLRHLWMEFTPPFKKRSFFGSVNSSDLVGYSHLMMTSKLDKSVDHFFQDDWEFAVPQSKASQALFAIKEYIHEHNMHFPVFGVFLRFARASDKTLLAHTASSGAFLNGEPLVIVEFPTPIPIGFSKDSQEIIDLPYTELARKLIIDFGARPHWGKNQDWAFLLENEQGTFGDNLEKFKSLAHSLDPNGMFANDFSNRVGLNENKIY